MKKERVILGKNCSYSADSRITGVNNNRVIVGGSGCGKTGSILEPELLELRRVYRRRAKARFCPEPQLRSAAAAGKQNGDEGAFLV